MDARLLSAELSLRPDLAAAPRAVAQTQAAARSDGLDLARALAILLVCIAHFGGLFAADTSPIFAALIYAGNAGVELFFSLSGFLIGRILIRLARDGLTAGSIGNFWARRWLRTLPLYYVTLVVVCWWLGLWDLRSFLFVQNFGFQSRPQPMIVSWSLVMEEYFYLSFPLLMLALSRLQPRRFNGLRCAAGVAVGLAVTCMLTRIGLNVAGLGGADGSFHLNPLLRLDCAAYGVLAACLWDTRRAMRLLSVPAMPALIVVAVLLFLLLDGTLYVRALGDAGFVRFIHYDTWKLLYVPSRDALMNAAFAVFVLALAEIRLGRALRFPARWLSRLSYSIYLVHVPVLFFLVPAVMPSATLAGRVTAAILATLALSFATYSLIETPFLALRDHIFPPRAKRPAAALV